MEQENGSTLAEVAADVQEQQEEVKAVEEVSGVETSEGQEEHVENKPTKSGFEKRVSKLNQKIELQRQEAEYWKEQALSRQQPARQAEQDEYQLPPKPTFAQYNDIDAYTDAVTDWKMLKVEVENIKRSEVRKQHEVQQNYSKRVQEYTKTNPDFAEAVAEQADAYCAPEIHEVALESDVGPAIVYYLSKNPDEIERINALSPKKRLLELGKLEDKLSTTETAETKKGTIVVKPIREAPAPIKTVKGAAVTGKSIYEMTPSELIAHRNKTVGHNR